MNVDLEDIRAMAARHPNMRVNTLLHQLEKRRKVEELRAEKAKEADKPLWSAFNRLMGRQS